MTTLGNAIAGEFRRILGEKKLTITQAAAELRVSRQAFHNYLNGKSLPRKQTLARAIERWGFNIAVGDANLDPNSFIEADEVPKPQQLLLWEALDGIRSEGLKVTVRRVESTLNVLVKIEIPA
jgi:transcriptional regulator with XRE-family HTH domain